MATAIAAASPCCFAPSLLSHRASSPPSSLRPPTCHARNLGLRVSARRNRVDVAVAVAAANPSGMGFEPDATPPSSPREVSFNPNHPRRKLLVQFKCNACGEYTDRAINRDAYDRGTVFVQCAGCLVHHKLVDNLGLIVEYDLREDLGANTNDAEI